MKKLLCLLFCLILLLSLASCGKAQEKAVVKSDEEQIKELILNNHKRWYGIATKEELRTVFSEAYWQNMENTALSFDAQLGTSMNRPSEDPFAIAGENHAFSVEIKDLTIYEDAAACKRHEEGLEHPSIYGYDVTVEAYCRVSYVFRITGDNGTYEDVIQNDLYSKIDGRWCIG